MKLDAKVKGGLAWAGLFVILAVPSADILFGKTEPAAQLAVTADTEALAAPKPARPVLAAPPADTELADAEARSRIAKVFEHGLTKPTGFVLPVQRWNAIAAKSRWVSEKWKTRRGKLFLAPGDSPAGYRLYDDEDLATLALSARLKHEE